MGISVSAPEINESLVGFTVTSPLNIRFGLSAIKNVGDKLAEAIVEERKKNGPFANMADYVARIDVGILNKKSMEALIKAGVFDTFEDRNKLLTNLEKLLEHARQEAKAKQTAQQGLFGAKSYKAKNISFLLESDKFGTFFRSSKQSKT